MSDNNSSASGGFLVPEGTTDDSNDFRGPQGPQGIQGPIGPQGPQGIQGPTGSGATQADLESLLVSGTYSVIHISGTATIANGAFTTATIGAASLTSATIGAASLTSATIGGLPVATQVYVDAASTYTGSNGVQVSGRALSLTPATGSVFGGVKSGANITNTSGVFSISTANVIAALGFTPYNSTNPSGYLTIASTFNLAPVTATGTTTSRTLADRFADVWKAADFGVKGDGVLLGTTWGLVTTDTNNPNVLIVGNGQFTSADAGKPIWVSGAGAAGATLATSVVLYVNQQQVTLAAPVQVTLTNSQQTVLYPTTYMTNVTGTITSGAPTTLILSGAPTIFAAADAFKSITVSGIGPAGAALTTTIATFDASTQIHLAASASTFVTAQPLTVYYGWTMLGAPLVTIASGTPTTMNVLGAAFTSADAGKLLAVAGIGAAAANFVSTVSAFQNSQTITMGAAATTFYNLQPLTVVYGTEGRAGTNSAVAKATVNGGTVELPAGVIIVNRQTGSIRVNNNVWLRGAGRGATTIVHVDMLSAGACIESQAISATVTATGFTISDLTIKGLCGTMVTNGGDLLSLTGVTNAEINRVDFVLGRGKAAVGRSSDTISITNCRINRCNADGFAWWGVSNIIISDNIILGANDDCISLHCNDTDAVPIRSGIVVSNNIVEDSQGMSILGAKVLSIVGNQMRRMMAYGIHADFDLAAVPITQGNSVPFGINIQDNIIHDVFLRQEIPSKDQAQFYIQVIGGSKTNGPNGAASPPGTPVAGTGVVTDFFGSNGPGILYLSGSRTVPPAMPGTYWLTIRGNQLIRTLGAVATWSQWGYGPALWCGSGAVGQAYVQPFNGPIPETALNTPGIVLSQAIKNADISGNIIATTGDSIMLKSAVVSWLPLDLDNVVIRDNQLLDFPNFGVGFFNGATTFGSGSVQRLKIIGNDFDGDPRFVSPNRIKSGQTPTCFWQYQNGAIAPNPDYAFGGCLGILLKDTSGVLVKGNRFRNVANPVALAASSLNAVTDNIAYCDPAVTGFSTSNKGIGTVNTADAGWIYVIEESDPVQATYGQIKQGVVTAASAQPSTGTWVQGQLVSNSARSISGGKILDGWRRLTTGSGNVAGTDWTPLYMSVS